MNSYFSKPLLKATALSTLAATTLIAGCRPGSRTSSARESTDVAPAVVMLPADSKAQNVGIDNFSFNPPKLTVAVGTTVTWVNHDDVPHTVTANDKLFASKTMDTDDRFSRQFSTPGTYAYFCAVHPHMTGQIIVK